MLRVTIAALMAVFALAVAPGVLADTVRVPKDGAPALATELADGWRSSYDGAGNLFLIAPDAGGVLMLAVQPLEAGANLDDLAKLALQVAKAEPFTSKTAGSIAGHPGSTYTAQGGANGARVQLVLTLAMIDDGHVACMARITRSDDTAIQRQLLDAAAATIKVIGS